MIDFKKILPVMVLASTVILSSAKTAPLWLRDVRISPDGRNIAFCYKGDIFTVPSQGGRAERLTTLDSYEQMPVWSPDGSTIAFSSNRYGGFDIFIVSSEGGSATRLTYNSVSETPLCFSPDGGSILFRANIQLPASSVQFPHSSYTQVYSVPVKGGKAVQVLGTTAAAISYAPDASFFVYQDLKGVEDEWRKHHISSVTRDIWKYDIATGKHTNLTSRPGEDLNPVVSPDGKTVYFISEPSDGDGQPKPEGWKTSLNVYSFDIDNPDEYKEVSFFDTHPVRFLSMGGGLLCYTWNGEIYTQRPGAEPSKVNISLTLDEENVPVLQKMTSGATETAVSPDGKQVAMIIRGDVFVTSVEYGSTKRITETPQEESGVCFGPDNRSIVYASDRSGFRQLYKASIVRDEDVNFPNATLVNEELIFPSNSVDRSDPLFSADGKKLAFIEGRTKLMVADVRSGEVTQVTDGSQWYDAGYPFHYDWSSDGRWFVLEYVPNHHDPYYNIGLVSAGGGDIVDITGSGYMNVQPEFSLDGDAVVFLSDRFGMRSHASWGSKQDVFVCFLNQDAYDRFRLSEEDYDLRKKARDSGKTLSVELKGLEDRIVRLTPSSSDLGSAIITADGKSMYYTARYERDFDLWKMDLRKKETKLVSKESGAGTFQADSTGKTIFLMGRSLRKLNGDKLEPVKYSAELRRDPYAEREYMFNYVCCEEQRRFYCEDMHGVDWKKYCEAYRRFLPHISNNFDFSEMLSELLGELNVSHTGSGYRPAGNTELTGSLGLLYDFTYEGEGLKVAEVLAKGPFDHADLPIAAGDIISHIDGRAVTDDADPSLLLRGKVGKKTLIGVKGKGDMVVIPISPSGNRDLLYERWVKRNAAEVERLSGGRLGYVHIRSMNDGSFRTIYNDILGKYNDCEGIVIDERFNGGGRLHEDIEVFFGGKKYLTQVVRGREACDMPSRRWNKPSIMLQCEHDYSNAHGTPWVYRHMGIGKLVGAPVPGTMTSVNWVDLLDPSLFFGIPVTGYRKDDGSFLENTQLEPDILVINAPEDVINGKDSQLEAAVTELLKEIDAGK